MQEQQDDETRARLLRAARVVFASDGLKRATIRKISTLARANIAAVNYHFGSKETSTWPCCATTWSKSCGATRAMLA